MRTPRPALVASLALSAALTACPDGSVTTDRAGSPAAPRTPPTPAPSSASTTAAPAASTSPPQSGRRVPYATWFVSASLGYAIDYECSPASGGVTCTYRVSVSHDAGATWKRTGRTFTATFARERGAGVIFISDRQGWIYGDALFQTNDGGTTWSRISTPSPGNDPCGLLPEPVTQFVAAGRDHWAVAGDCAAGRCPGVYTSAGGRGRMCRADPVSPLQSARIIVTAQAVFALIGEGRQPARVARTLDGGHSWRMRESPCGGDNGATLTAVGRARLWLACYDEPVTGMQSGRIFENPDFGETWYVRSDTGLFGRSDPSRPRTGNLPSGGHAGDLVALPNAELVLTRNKFPSIHRSTDGGRTWRMVLNNPDTQNLRLQFIDSQSGWAHAGVGLYRTTDGGRTWNLIAGSASV